MEAETEERCRGLRVPGGRDREGRPVAIFCPPPDRPAHQLQVALPYLLSLYSEETRRGGLRLVVECGGTVRRGGWTRLLSTATTEENLACLVLRPEAFWDKGVDHCAKSPPGPIFIPPSRLHKYIDASQLPEDLGGTLSHDRDKWLRERIKSDLFFHESRDTMSELDRVTRLLTGAREGTNNAARTMTQTRATYNNTTQAATALIQQGRALLDELGMGRLTETIGQDVLDTRQRVEREVTAARNKVSALQSAWAALNKSIADAKEVEKLECGVKKVTEWLLTKGEELLASHCHVGFDITSAEQLRREHEQLELACRETYGQYAELLHKLDCSGLEIPADLKAQRDFMDFVIRGFATRIERRRNILISSARFFRLVAEYFQTTSEIYEKLVMTPDVAVLDKAQSTLLQLQESQNTIDELEDWVMREGEKLSDLLAMPVKDSLGREVIVDYGPDITNISEILEMSRARSELFRDNVELQRITLQQASHVYTYENDAAQAIMWLDELFEVMLDSHSEVGCNVLEIQKQKEEQQNFEETAKCTYEFGSQLLRGALLLRQACKLGETENRHLSERLTDSWLSLTTAGQAHLTRLRVTAVFHRDMDKHEEELKQLIDAAELAKGEDLRELLESREAVLLEVARMIRLARLLKSRLREPLSSKQSVRGEYNRTGVEAIAERVAEVTALAEQLDQALSARVRRSVSPSNSREDWYGSLEKSGDSSSSWKEEEEFVTASECTPPSRSSSFHTASEGCLSPWWSDNERALTGSEAVEVKETQKVVFSKEGVTVDRQIEATAEVSEHWHGYIFKDFLHPEEVSERLEVKVLEVEPDLCQLGTTLRETEDLRRAHHDLIHKIQSKKSPVEELVDQAEAVISRQRTSPRVYSAMSRSLTAAWEDLQHHLLLRARILDLNLNYHRWAEEFGDCCSCTETLCEQEPPTSGEEMRARLEELRAGEREALSRLGRTLAAGAELLGALRALEESAADSRPGHRSLAIALAVAQVEGWMENLHSQRTRLQSKTSKAVVELEECLELAFLTGELAGLQKRLEERALCLASTVDQLADTSAAASLLLHEHNKLLPEAKDMQDQALKIVRTSEEFAKRGHFAGPDAVAQAYLVLEQTAEYIANIERREEILKRVIAFFTSGEQTLIKLDQLEVRLSTADLGLDPEQLRVLHDEVSRSLEDVTSGVLQEGYRILEDIPTSEGVKRMVEQIENKKINLSVQCTAHKEENVRANAAYKIFLEKYSLLNAFLSSMEAYLSGVRSMGENLTSAKEYLNVYKRNLNDLQNKTPEIKALISSGREVGGRRQTEIADSCLELESRWCSLSGTLESRIALLSSYVRALSLLQNIELQLDIITDVIKLNENEMKGEQALITARQLQLQFENTASNFYQDSLKGGGLEGGRECLERERQRTVDRSARLEEDWSAFTLRRRHLHQQSRQLWEDTMAASNKTVDWVSKLYDQLYPVLNPELHSARQLAGHVEHKLNTVVPEIKRALTEIQLRQETAQALLSKSEFQDANESITERLRDLSTRLNAISADYQVLLEKMLTFFTNLSQIENLVERGQREEITSLANFNETVENLRKSLDADQKSVSAMFDLCHAECALVLERIKAQEGSKGDSDCRTVETSVDSLRYAWQRLLTSRESKILQMEKRIHFDMNLKEIERSLEGLSSKLLSSRGYGESLSEALSASKDFQAFERTIELLEVKVTDFIQSGQDICNRDGSSDIERDLAAIRQKWRDIKEQVKQAREKIQLTIQLFTLVQEAENWFRDGNRLLTSIMQRSTSVKTYKEVMLLIQELEGFFKPGEVKQNERIAEISRLADILYGTESTAPPNLFQVKSDNREMFASFSQISSELKAMSDKLRTPSPQPIIQLMDVDADKPTHGMTHSTTVIREYSSTFIERTVREGLTPSPGLRIEEVRKTPSPPPKKVKVSEDVPPMFTIQLTNATVDEGSSFCFRCRVSGKPNPSVRWEKDGVIIDDKNTDYKVTRNENGDCCLRIEETFTEDSARFSCIAINPAGSALTTAVLNVRECVPENVPSPPEFLIPLKATSVLEGAPMELRCSLKGVPLPTVQWFLGKRCIENDLSFNITYNNGEATLVKRGVTPNDEGEYSCVASNVVGTVTTRAPITVKRKTPEITVPPPTFIRELTNVMARAGQKVRLDVEVIGAERVDWTHDGRVVLETPEIKLIREGNNASLIISEAFPKDAGVYCIKASNKVGSSLSSGTVQVKGRLPEESSDTGEEMEPARPVVQIPLKDLSVFEGKKVRLDCVIVAHPEPEVIWYHDGVPVKESSDIQLVFHGDRCSLVIAEALVEDSGTYRVVALNSAGEAHSEAFLNVTPVDKKSEVKPGGENEALEGKPVFKKLLSDTLVKVGESVCLSCEVEGRPMPTVSWARNNLELQQSERIHMSQDSEGHCSLKIKDVVAEDKGVYTAKAVNQLGEAKCFSQLIVKTPVTLESLESAPLQPAPHEEAPAFLQLFSDAVVTEGTPVKFECVVTGKPTPKIRWLYNGEPVSGRDFLASTSGPRQVLTIPTATKALAGSITCSAENTIGRANCTAKLIVTDSTKVLDDIFETARLADGAFEMKRAIFVESSSSSHFTTSSSTTANGVKPHVEVKSFTSKSEATSQKVGDKPPVSVEVHKTSEYTNIDGLETRGETSSVKSSGLEKSDSGLVISKRKATAPRFVSPLNGCIVDQGRPVTMEAIIDGHPCPEVKWSRNGGALPEDAEVSWSVGKAALRIPSAGTQHAGKYQLTATNSAGSATSSADVVVKIDHSHSGDYSVTARNSAGEARSSAQVQVVDPPPPTGPAPSLLSDLVSGSSSEIFKTVIPGPGHTQITTYKRPGESVVVEESFQSQKEVSMKVRHSEEVYDSSLEIKKDFSKVEPFKIVKASPLEPVKVPEPVKQPDPMPTQPVSQTQNEDLITESISTKSSLDFFKNIIKENEEEKKRMATEPKPEPIKLPKPSEPKPEPMKLPKPSEPVKFPSEPIKFSNLPETPKPSLPAFTEDIKLSKEISSISQSYSENLFSSVQQSTPAFEEFNLEPGPPPEIGYMPKSAATKPKEEVAEKAKKLAETQRQLSEVEVPSGGVRIFPVIPPSTETKKFESYEEKREEKIVKSPLMRAASPRPSAEGVAMERLWTTKLEHKPTLEKPKSPLPVPVQVQETSSSSTQSFSSQKFSESKVESFQSVVEKKVEPQPFIFQPKKIEPPKPEQKIIYVAEAHATHRTNVVPETQISQRSGYFESGEESSSVVTEKTLLPSEAKKIWPPGLPVQPEQTPIKKVVPKFEPKPTRSSSVPQGFDDIQLEPGPPPEIGFATPPKERRTSYVEQIEQDLEKDLEKEPSKHLPGAVRTIPPPKRESSVETINRVYQRSSSMYEESSVKSMKAHKYSTVPRPTKFVKKAFESDYESDLEGTKIKSRWTPWDSDTEEPKYRKVNPPTITSQPPRPHSATPFTLFKPIPLAPDGKHTPQDSGYMADTEEPRTIFKKSQFRSDKVVQSKQERKIEKKENYGRVEFKPIGGAPKPMSEVGFRPLKPGSPPQLGFAPPLSGVETSNTVNYAENTGSTQRFVSVKQTTRVLGSSEAKRIQRVEEMRQRFGDSLVNLQPGEPPQYDYAPPVVPSAAASVVNKSLNEMTSTFKSKAQQFVSEVASDVKQSEKAGPILKKQQSKEPEVYREESRVAEHGTKEIDPNTGLIYFKYDFGYEFGVVAPGAKGWVASKKATRGEDGVPFPVHHEKKSVKWEQTPQRALQSPGVPAWTSGASSPASSPVVFNQMLHCQQPLKPPVFTTPLRDIAVVSGSSGRFECIVEAHPQPTVTWSRAGHSQLPPDAATAFRNGVCRLDIPTAFPHLGGRYICTATNSSGKAETSATLSVTGEERTFISS